MISPLTIHLKLIGLFFAYICLFFTGLSGNSASHSLILKTDGSLWSTGSGKFGKTGNGQYGKAHLPVKIVESGVAGIATGSDHSLYWTDTGEVYVFGYNGLGQLGLGTTLYVKTPRTLDVSKN